MNLSGGIDAYFQEINRVLGDSPVIKSQDVRAEKRTPTEGFLRGDVIFKDDSRLHFRELVTTEPVVQRISYAYHYQRADGAVVFRYDDSDHFLHLPNAPHHKHIGEMEVTASNAPNLEFVLQEIEGLVQA
ncbi:MAG: DUF6516 family protein [Chloroflexota bacterium]